MHSNTNNTIGAVVNEIAPCNFDEILNNFRPHHGAQIYNVLKKMEILIFITILFGFTMKNAFK